MNRRRRKRSARPDGGVITSESSPRWLVLLNEGSEMHGGGNFGRSLTSRPLALALWLTMFPLAWSTTEADPWAMLTNHGFTSVRQHR